MRLSTTPALRKISPPSVPASIVLTLDAKAMYSMETISAKIAAATMTSTRVNPLLWRSHIGDKPHVSLSLPLFPENDDGKPFHPLDAALFYYMTPLEGGD